jgi:LTXXQ motif family protein
MSTLGYTVVRSLAVLAAAAALSGSAQAQTSQLSGLHDALHLNPAQEDGWRAYVAAISPDPMANARHQETGRMLPSLPTPRRVDLINAQVDADAAMVHRQGVAVKAFYAGLSPTQQQTFDRLTAAAQGGQQQQQQQGGSRFNQPPNNALPPPH